MKTMQNIYVGIDVSGDWLDIFLEPIGCLWRYQNNDPGVRALSQKLGEYCVAGIVLEATGGLERICATELRAAGLPVHVVNPARISGFRSALGKIAKTDALDAKVIALFAASIRQTNTAATDPLLCDLKDLGARHTQLTQTIAAEKNRLKRVHHPLAHDSIERIIKALKAERDDLETIMRALIESDASIKSRYDILLSIPGIGPLNALTLIYAMPELGTLTDRQISALAGLAPMNKDSGKITGNARLRGGRKHVRQMLYMAAMAAKRFNPVIASFFARLVKNGKPRKLALIAAMRKLLLIANTLLRKQQHWITPA